MIKIKSNDELMKQVRTTIQVIESLKTVSTISTKHIRKKIKEMKKLSNISMKTRVKLVKINLVFSLDQTHRFQKKRIKVTRDI